MDKSKAKSKDRVPACPSCKSRKSVVPIIYGYPPEGGFEQGGEYALGGCCVENSSPQWICRECGHTWGRVLKEKRVMRELLQECRRGPNFEIEIIPTQSGSYMVGIFEDGRICKRVGPFENEAEARRAMDDIKADWREKPGTEGFSIGSDGKKSDAGLYDDNPEADHYFAITSCSRVLKEFPENPEGWYRLYQVTPEEVRAYEESLKKGE
jgi:hypothetical protein